MSDFAITRAGAGDIEAASSLLKTVVQSLKYYNDRARKSEINKFKPEGLNAFVRDDSKVVFVARAVSGANKGDLVGLIIAGEDDALMWINWFIVHPDFRRQGLATKLIDELAHEAESRSCHKIWCDCRVENIPSATLLLREGFKMIARVDNHWYGQDFYLWERALATS